MVMKWSRFREIKSAVDREDIEGLLALECPSDEYDGEASLIETGVAKATNFGKTAISVEQVEKIVRTVWNNQFGPFDPPELEKRRSGFASVAHRIAESL